MLDQFKIMAEEVKDTDTSEAIMVETWDSKIIQIEAQLENYKIKGISS